MAHCLSGVDTKFKRVCGTHFETGREFWEARLVLDADVASLSECLPMASGHSVSMLLEHSAADMFASSVKWRRGELL
jgi:hypothetical protein